MVIDIISLDSIFYQSDCHYYELSKNEKSEVNRMGTENYKESDFNRLTDELTFDKYPINL